MKKTKKLLSFFLAIVMVIATIPAFSITASAATTDATKSNNENSVTNRILIDNAIYTYASESAYYNYGTTISTTDSWSTKIYFRNGASSTNLKSITCLDDGSKLSVVNNILQGSFTDNKFKVSGATDVTATLLFTFNDGTKEYHRVAVKSYPVENHIACDAVKVPWRGDRTESGYTMFMRGSTGSGGAEGVWKFQKSYATSGTATHAIDDANGANGIITSDKKAYAHGYAEGGDAVPNVITKATYYIDKSCHGTSWEGLGNSELWNGTNYVVPIEVIRTKFFHNNGKYWNFDLNNMPVQNKLVRTTNSSTTNVNANGTTYGLSFTHNASVDETNRYASGTDTTCNIRIAVRTTDAGWALLKTNLIVKLFDKSTARSKYDELITKNLVESNYTASSFATYQNALMAMEAYLSNYEDTSEASTSSKVYTDLVNAYNGLAPRATEAEYQAMVTAYTNYKAVIPNKDKYTKSSYNTFYNDVLNAQITDTDLINAETDALSIKNQVEADSSAMRDVAKSACTTYTNKFNEYLNKLVERADFTDLASKYTDAAAKLAETDKYTTSTYNALKSVYDNAKYAKYDAAQKADTPKADNQNAIDTESANIQDAIDNLVERADFRNYNASVDNSTTDLSSYTSQSSQYLPTYNSLQPFGDFTLYTEAQKNDTGVSQQETVNNNGDAIENARTAFNGTAKIDQSALQAFVSDIATYDKDVFDTKTVDAIKASANALYKVVNFNGTDYYSLDVTDKEDLDSKIRDYINSFNNALDKYSVSVSSNVTVKVNGFTQSPNAETGKYEFVYGTRVEFSAPTADTAWYMNYTSESAKRTQQFQKYAQTYTATIIGNMEVDARTKSDATPYRVTVERDYGVDGMTNGMAFVDFTAGGDYTLPTMPNHPYYSFDGYYVGGAKLNSNTVNITGNTTIIAKYVKNGEYLTVNVNGSSSTYAYNSKVTISEPGAYAWVEKVNGTADTWRPFYIGSGCTFRVTESIDLKPVTQEQFNSMFAGKEAFAPNTRQSGAIADASTNKATINAQRVDYLPEGAQITEYGILVAKDARTDDFNLENTNEQSIRAKSTKLISGNQFSIGLTNLANTNFTYRSYMIYQVPATTDESGNVTSWETKTVYSEIMTYSGATV